MLHAFSPPSALEKRQAIGSLAGTSLVFRKSIEKSEEFFQDINRPGQEDWLASNFEHGQTFDQYKIYANIPSAKKNKFYIQPYDSKLSLDLLKILKNYSTVFFPGVKFILRKAVNIENLEIDSRIGSEGIQQFNASKLLNKMYKIAPLDRCAMIGITSEDIYHVEEWTFVFGLANVINKTGIFSFARYTQEFYSLPPDPELVVLRAVKVMLHEMCHMFGLLHCIYFKCLMNGSNHIYETDSKPVYLCPVCLRKLHLCLQFNPITRYEQLSKVCAELGGYFMEYSEWYARRAAKIIELLPKNK